MKRTLILSLDDRLRFGGTDAVSQASHDTQHAASGQGWIFWKYRRLHRFRNPEVCRAANPVPAESPFCDAHNRERRSADADRPPDCRRIRQELAAPVVIADDGNR